MQSAAVLNDCLQKSVACIKATGVYQLWFFAQAVAANHLWRLRITRSLKPPRAYITGSKEVGAKKLPLIVEVSGKRSKKYNQVIDLIYNELQEKHLTKEEAIQLRDELC